MKRRKRGGARGGAGGGRGRLHMTVQHFSSTYKPKAL